MSDVIDNLANHLNDTGLRVQDLSHDQITQMLLESAQRVRVNNASKSVSNIMPNLRDDVRTRQAQRNRFLSRFGRDADMAEEMTTFTRNQIMTDSATAMLAQANSRAQSVLRLLQ